MHKEYPTVTITGGSYAGDRGLLLAADAFTSMVQIGEQVVYVDVRYVVESEAA